MTEKKYEFTGVDAKTELVLGLIAGVIALIVLFLATHCYTLTHHMKFAPQSAMETCARISLAVSLFVLKLISVKRRGLWQITNTSHTIEVKYNNKSWTFNKSSITEINFVGAIGFRYLTLKSNEQKIKIRVGIGDLTPFSKKGDLEIVDLFISDFKPYLSKHFTHIWGKMYYFDNEGKYKRIMPDETNLNTTNKRCNNQ